MKNPKIKPRAVFALAMVPTIALTAIFATALSASAATFYKYYDGTSNIGIRNSSSVATISGGAVKVHTAGLTPLTQIIETHYKADSRTIYGRASGQVGAGFTYLYHAPKLNAVSRCYYYDTNYSVTNWSARKECHVYK